MGHKSVQHKYKRSKAPMQTTKTNEKPLKTNSPEVRLCLRQHNKSIAVFSLLSPSIRLEPLELPLLLNINLPKTVIKANKLS